MLNPGCYNTLRVFKITDAGYLLGNEDKPVFLPLEDSKPKLNQHDEITVFVYYQNGILRATTALPFACAGDFTYLEVVALRPQGAYFDLGIDVEVLAERKDQHEAMTVGAAYVVFLYIENGHFKASSLLGKFIDHTLPALDEGDCVNLLLCDEDEISYRAIINNRHAGLLYKNELYQPLDIGEQVEGYIKKFREDNTTVILSLYPTGYEFILQAKTVIIELLMENKGTLPLGDKSKASEIQSILKMSKKRFKQVIGSLYKDREISISDYEIKLKIDSLTP